jgi:hypothetical protein
VTLVETVVVVAAAAVVATLAEAVAVLFLSFTPGVSCICTQTERKTKRSKT